MPKGCRGLVRRDPRRTFFLLTAWDRLVLGRGSWHFSLVSPLRRQLIVLLLCLGAASALPLHGDAPALIVDEHTVRVPGAFGIMRRVDSTTLILPNASELVCAQKQRDRRSAENETRRRAREAQSAMETARKRAETETAAQAGAGAAEAAMAPASPEPVAEAAATGGSEQNPAASAAETPADSPAPAPDAQ